MKSFSQQLLSLYYSPCYWPPVLLPSRVLEYFPQAEISQRSMTVTVSWISREPMQSVLSNLLASLLLIQVLTGWCDHSAQNCHEPDSVSGSHCCAAHQAGRSAQCSLKQICGSQSDRCHERHCQGVCTYIPAPNAYVNATPSAFDFVSSAVVAVGTQLSPRCDFERACVSVQSRPPLRLHLWHQVILI